MGTQLQATFNTISNAILGANNQEPLSRKQCEISVPWQGRDRPLSTRLIDRGMVAQRPAVAMGKLARMFQLWADARLRA